MKVLFISFVCISTFCWCFAEDDRFSKEKAMDFMKCICRDERTHQAYEKCKELEPEKSRNFSNECRKSILPKELNGKEQIWKYICANLKVAENIFDCIITDENIKSLSKEETTSFNRFRECGLSVYTKHCHKPVE